MPAPSHTYGQSTVTAVQLVPVYPSDSAFPLDTAYPDTMYAPVGPLDATLVSVVNGATLAAVRSIGSYPDAAVYPDSGYPDSVFAVVGLGDATLSATSVGDARLLATSFGGAALTPTAALIQLT